MRLGLALGYRNAFGVESGLLSGTRLPRPQVLTVYEPLATKEEHFPVMDDDALATPLLPNGVPHHHSGYDSDSRGSVSRASKYEVTDVGAIMGCPAGSAPPVTVSSCHSHIEGEYVGLSSFHGCAWPGTRAADPHEKVARPLRAAHVCGGGGRGFLHVHAVKCGGGGTGGGYGRPVDRGAWAAKTVKRPRQQPAPPQYANHWAPRTRKRHQQEHRPQRPTESSDPTQHAKGRTGECPGPRKETDTRRNVTQAGGIVRVHVRQV